MQKNEKRVRLIPLVSSLRRPTSPGSAHLHLHIGMPKTGTTAIQSVLAYNRERLERRHGILYPECGTPVNQHTALVKSMAADAFPWTRFNAAIDRFDADAYIGKVLDQCRQKGCHKVVVSSEFFWAAPAMQAGLSRHAANDEHFAPIEQFIRSCRQRFGEFGKTTVIVYLRRQGRWIDSFFNQQLKDGFDIPENEELLSLKNYLLYGRNLEIWSRYFGRENIVVRVYRDDSKWDAVSDFTALLGVKRKTLASPPDEWMAANPSLSPLSAKIMRSAIRIKLEPDTMAALKSVLADLSRRNRPREESGAPRRMFSPAFHETVRRIYRRDNEDLAALFPETRPLLEPGRPSTSPAVSKDPMEAQPEGSEVETLIYSLLRMIESRETSGKGADSSSKL